MEKTLLRQSYDLNTIKAAARSFWDIAEQYNILAFSGDMGAGKTTFIHNLCDVLGVQDSVTSPTFALINEYHFTEADAGDKTIYHMDWYRLKDMEEALNAGMEDCLIQGIKKEAWCFIEWPEKAEDMLFEPYLWVSIKVIDINDRDMEVVLISE